MVIYFGDLVCFRREVIPLYYEENGTVSTIPFIDFPHVFGGRNIFSNSDFLYLNYMMQRTQTGISLSETIRNIEASRQRELNPPTLDSNIEPTQESVSGDEADDSQGEGGIW